MNFIEVTKAIVGSDGVTGAESLIINKDSVVLLTAADFNSTVIHLRDGVQIRVVESYDSLKSSFIVT